MLSREPVHRPIDVMLLEVTLSVTQALLVGVLLWLAAGFWTDRGVPNGPVLLGLVILGLAVGAAWLSWLVGGPGWPMAALNIPVAMIMGGILLLGLAGTDTGRVGIGLAAICLVFALLGIVCGFFLPGPHRPHWKDGMSRPRRTGSNAPPPRVTPATARLMATLGPTAGTIRRTKPEAPPGPLPEVTADELAASTATATTLTPSSSGSAAAVAGSKAAPAEAAAAMTAAATAAATKSDEAGASGASGASIPSVPTPTATVPPAGAGAAQTMPGGTALPSSTSVAPTVPGSLPSEPPSDPRFNPPPDTRPWPRPQRPPQP